MKLIIMRHGEAEQYEQPDDKRSLTTFGENQAKIAGQWLAKYLGEDESIDLALVSNFFRAQQTFQHLNQQLQVLDKQNSNDVVPSGNPKIVHDFLQTIVCDNMHYRNLLIVSHMPFVSYFLEEVHVHKQSMLFDTSTMVILDYDPKIAAGKIDVIYHPK